NLVGRPGTRLEWSYVMLARRAHGRAHMEIHPVDYLARVVPSHRSQPSTYTALTLCDNATIDAMEIMPPEGGPAGAPVGVKYTAVGAFSTPSPLPSIQKLADKVRVTANAPNWQDSSGPHKGKFFALFRVYWDTPCPTGQTLCQNSCLDTQSFQNDDSNCGQCGYACQGGTSCSAGKCMCPAGWTLCNGVCKTLATDWLNCGGCGVFCDPLAVGSVGVCAAGSCVCPASAPSVCSYGNERVCTNLEEQIDNCGTCGHHCINGSC